MIRIYKTNNDTYRTWDPSTNKYKSFKTIKEAKDYSHKLNVLFYSSKENKKLLPKGIYLDLENKRFRFAIRTSNNEMLTIILSKDLEKVVNSRKHVIMNLLDLIK